MKSLQSRICLLSYELRQPTNACCRGLDCMRARERERERAQGGRTRERLRDGLLAVVGLVRVEMG